MRGLCHGTRKYFVTDVWKSLQIGQPKRTKELVCLGRLLKARLSSTCTEERELFQFLRVAPPIVVMITMLGMKGWRIVTHGSGSAAAFDRDPVFVPELVFEAFDGLVQDEV